jgi:hypothetical protein
MIDCRMIAEETLRFKGVAVERTVRCHSVQDDICAHCYWRRESIIYVEGSKGVL